jgi:hypothetical protein
VTVLGLKRSGSCRMVGRSETISDACPMGSAARMLLISNMCILFESYEFCNAYAVNLITSSLLRRLSQLCHVIV